MARTTAVSLRLTAGSTILLAVAGCSSDSAGPGSSAPTIVSASIGTNPHNALSALVRYTSRNADSARLLYRRAGSNAEQSTPFYRIHADTGTLAALGLASNASYDVTLEVSAGEVAVSTSLGITSGSLPSELSALRLNPIGTPGPGYVLTDFTSVGSAYLVALDSSGGVAWYRSFATQPGEIAIDAEQRSDGNYTLFVGVSTGWQATPGRFFEVTPAGDSVRAHAAASPFYTDPHELLFDYGNNGIERIHIIGYDQRRVDLTSVGGKPDQVVAGHVILRQSAAGAIEFVWNAWDHFSIADWIFVQPGVAQLPSIDFDHPNSIDRDEKGNYIVSFASLGEITKIDATNGQIIWRFGGRHNQFTFVNDPMNGFGIQHDVRLLPNGDLIMVDNGLKHVPPETRAVQYRLDLVAHTATLVWEYRHNPPLFAPFAGSVQRFANGNTLVAFGAEARVAEVAANGNVIWESQLTDNGRKVPFFYRARRIKSLYR